MKYIICTLTLITLFTSCKNDQSEKETGIKVSTKHIEKVIEVKQPEIVTQDDSELSGEFIEKYPNGNIKTEGWNNNDGKRDKTWYSYFDNGIKWSESNYKNGLKEGKSIVYYPNGKERYSGTYTADKKSGHWVFYNETGEIQKEENY